MRLCRFDDNRIGVDAAKFYTLYPGDVLTAEVTRIGAMTVAIRSRAS